MVVSTALEARRYLIKEGRQIERVSAVVWG